MIYEYLLCKVVQFIPILEQTIITNHASLFSLWAMWKTTLRIIFQFPIIHSSDEFL